MNEPIGSYIQVREVFVARLRWRQGASALAIPSRGRWANRSSFPGVDLSGLVDQCASGVAQHSGLLIGWVRYLVRLRGRVSSKR